jgi:hypothetical protein
MYTADMKNLIKPIANSAAIFNIVASALFWHAQGRQFVDQTAADVSTSLGNLFFLASLVLWASFITISLLVQKNSK